VFHKERNGFDTLFVIWHLNVDVLVFVNSSLSFSNSRANLASGALTSSIQTD